MVNILKHVTCLLAIASAGCSVSDFSNFEHPATQHFQPNPDKVITAADLEKNSQFIDSGVLFVPSVRELAWGDDYRSFILLYSKNPLKIKVDQIQISSERHQTSAVLTIDQVIDIAAKEDGSMIFHAAVPAIFENADGAAEALSASEVTMTVRYRIPVGSKHREKQFILKRRIKVGESIRDILAAC